MRLGGSSVPSSDPPVTCSAYGTLSPPPQPFSYTSHTAVPAPAAGLQVLAPQATSPHSLGPQSACAAPVSFLTCRTCLDACLHPTPWTRGVTPPPYCVPVPVLSQGLYSAGGLTTAEEGLEIHANQLPGPSSDTKSGGHITQLHHRGWGPEVLWVLGCVSPDFIC